MKSQSVSGWLLASTVNLFPADALNFAAVLKAEQVLESIQDNYETKIACNLYKKLNPLGLNMVEVES